MNISQFYNRYHQKNNKYGRIMGDTNFTYFYILQFLHQACIKHFGQSHKESLKNLRVLDVGCGVGTLALYIAQYAAWVTGLDISKRAIDIAQSAKRTTGLKNCTFRTVPLEREQDVFDVIMCTEVIEHMKDDSEFVKLLHKRLKRGGALMLTTPSRENWMYERGWLESFDAQVGHVRRYTLRGLERLLKKHGFRVVLSRQVEGVLRNVLFTTKLGFLIRFIKGPLVPLFHWFDMISVKLWGPTDIQIFAIKER